MREMDISASAGSSTRKCAELDARDIGDLERLLDAEDQKAFSWLCGTTRRRRNTTRRCSTRFWRSIAIRGAGERLNRPGQEELSEVKELQRAVRELERGGAVALSRAPDGFDAFAAADLARALAAKAEGRSVVFAHVARDGQRSRAFQDAFAFAAPEMEILDFPSWDCQPYDRVSPNAAITARRMTALSRLARSRQFGGAAAHPLHDRQRHLCSASRRCATVATDTFSAAPGNVVKTDDLVRWLENNGFLRSSAVRETGEYAMRGGIVDLFAAGHAAAGAPRLLRRYAGDDPCRSIRKRSARPGSCARSISCR